MGYLHIQNLYKDQTILMFRECYALEKIHGTSAHVSWNEGRLGFFSGGEPYERFKKLFDEPALTAAFERLGHPKIIVYGEAYGGKQQGQSHRYGPALKFVAFDVQIGEHWLIIPSAADIVETLGLEFVHYAKVSTDLAALDAERDAPSVQAVRNGVAGAQTREGIVLHPLIELTGRTGERIVAKHKRDEERETATPRPFLSLAPMNDQISSHCTRHVERLRTRSSCNCAHAVPISTRSFKIASFETPVMRDVDRTEHPSIRAETIWTRLSSES